MSLFQDEVRAMLAQVKAALEGDPDVAEHDALMTVAGVFGIEWVVAEDLEEPDPSLRSDWVELWTVDGQHGAGIWHKADDDQVQYVDGGAPKYIEWPFIRSINFPNRGG